MEESADVTERNTSIKKRNVYDFNEYFVERWKWVQKMFFTNSISLLFHKYMLIFKLQFQMVNGDLNVFLYVNQ